MSTRLNPTYVVDTKFGDVTGDKILDKVFLTGRSTADSPFVENITLKIQDGKTKRVYTIPLKTNAGYNPTIFLGEFTGNKVCDILISMDSGGSGGMQFHYIFSFLRCQPRMLFDYEEFNKMYTYEVIYRNCYKVDVISNYLNKIYRLDIVYKGRDYLSEIYDKNGKLKEPVMGFVNPLSSLWPVDIDRDGIYELFAVQNIAGRYNADGLGYVETVLRWNGSEFAPLYQLVAINGTNLC